MPRWRQLQNTLYVPKIILAGVNRLESFSPGGANFRTLKLLSGLDSRQKFQFEFVLTHARLFGLEPSPRGWGIRATTSLSIFLFALQEKYAFFA